MKEIEQILQFHDSIDWTTEKAALGTIVHIEESSYRRIGARMYVKSNGEWVGGISGGCLEGDALKKAQMAILMNKTSLVVYDTMDDDSHQIGVGLGCNGKIEVLFGPINPDDENNQIEILRKLVNKRKESVLLHTIQSTNHPRLVARLFTSDCIDEFVKLSNCNKTELVKNKQHCLNEQKSKIYTLATSEGSNLKVLFEYIRPKINLVCIGDNYDLNSILNLSSEMAWQIQLVGKVSKLAKNIYEKAHKIYDVNDEFDIPIDEFTAIVLMSHDYTCDLNYLKKYLGSKAPYLGLLGPKKRMLKMQAELGIKLENNPKIFSPAGLDIGAETPEEIALSILSEIVAVFRKREGQSLKFRKQPIHER